MKDLKKINQILFLLLAVFALIYFGSSFFIPLVIGIFLAMLMTPFSNILEKIKINRIISSLISTLVVFIVVGGILYIFFFQISLFLSDISTIKEKIYAALQNIQNEITTITNISLEEQESILKNRSESILNTIESGLTGFVGNILNTLFKFLLVLVYLILLLLYRNKFFSLVMRNTIKENEENTKEILFKTSKVVYHYLWGRVKVMSILAILYYVSFLIFDIPYALLLTVFGALVTIIPYLGPFISGLLPILFSFIYLENLQTAFIFSIIIIIIQLIESYVLEPLIIGNEVKINPLMVIIAIAMGGMIWGIAGMVLFVPIFAIIKIIFNHTPGLESVGYLFGTSKQSKI